MTRREAVLDGLPVAPSDFVVEIGAGPSPFRHTKLILDKYPFDDLERHAGIAGTAPVIQADAARLPLKRGSCDWIFASHVIEHLPEPKRFLEEARRCARRVYLEFPKARYELMYAWSYHRWLVERQGSRLVFHENDVPQVFGPFFHEHYDLLLDTWSAERHGELSEHWSGDPAELEVEFSGVPAFEHVVASSARGTAKRRFATPYSEEGVGPVAYSWRARAKLALWSLTPASLVRGRRKRVRAKAVRRDPLADGILARLLCLACRDEAAAIERVPGTAELSCGGCGRRYRAKDGVFDFDGTS